MNHRQWKKNFKKQHGRNPYWFEDKKRVRNTPQARTICRALGSMIRTIQEQFVPTLLKAYADPSQACVEAGRAAALALRMPEPIAIEKTEYPDWRTLTQGRPMQNAVCRLVEENQEEKDGV